MFSRRAFLNLLQYQILILTITSTVVQSLPEPTNNTQKVWQIHSYGNSKQLRFEETPLSNVSNPNQLLIKVQATALNPIDLEMLGGYGKSFRNILGWFKPVFPLVLGREFAGIVVDKGHSVSDEQFKIGDEVYGIIPAEQQGSLREYLFADKLNVLQRPPQLSVIEAASVLFTSITAWSALFLTGGLASQDTSKAKVLVLGASGGVGTVAIQILKSQNVTVVGLCATDAVPLVTSLGANFVHDYKNPEHILQVASHGVYDIIFDCANYGYEKVPKEWTYKTFVTLNAPVIKNADKFGIISGLLISGSELISANAVRIFSGKSVQWAFFSPHPDAFKFVDKLIRNNQLKPVIQNVFNFTQVPEAFDKLAAKHSRGKIVIDWQ